jgi:hypothetical protein
MHTQLLIVRDGVTIQLHVKYAIAEHEDKDDTVEILEVWPVDTDQLPAFDRLTEAEEHLFENQIFNSL